MKKSCFVSMLVVVVQLAVGVMAEAQQPTKVPWIGYLAGAGSGPSPAFIQGLRDLGYVEGKNIAFVFRTTEGKNERYSDLAAELVRLNVDIIVVGGNTGIRAAKKATSTIPIVMLSVGDPAGLGLVASLARPSGNITGVVANVPGLDRKTARAAKGNIAQGNASSLYSRPGQSWNDTEIQGGTDRGASIGDQVAIPRCAES